MSKSKILKFSVLFLAVALFASFSFFGCKGEADPVEKEAASEGTTEETATTEEAADETGEEASGPENPVTLDMWFQDWTAGIEITTEFANLVKEKYPNITINIIPIARGAMTEKTVPAIMSGTEPEIIFGYSSDFEEADATELFLSITPDLFSKEELESKFYKVFLKQAEGKDGNYYSLPWGSGSDGWGVVVNNKLLEEAGIEFTSGVIKEFDSWDKLKAAAKKATQYNEDGSIKVSGFSLADYPNAVPMFPSFVLSLGYEPFLDGVWDWTSPECKQSLEEIYSLKTEKIFDPEAGDAYTAFPKGLVAMAAFGPWAIGAIGTDYPEMELSYVNIPPLNSDNPKYVITAWAMLYFSKKVKDDPDKLAAVKVIAKELAEASYPMIQINKWAGTCANIAFIEGLKDGSLIPDTPEGKVNAEIALELIETHVPYLEYPYTESGISTTTINHIMAQEIEKLFTGQQDVEATLQSLTDILNEEEALK